MIQRPLNDYNNKIHDLCIYIRMWINLLLDFQKNFPIGWCEKQVHVY